jgi:hypothetical protein
VASALIKLFFHFPLVPNLPHYVFIVIVLNEFPSGSQYVPQVLNVFLNMFSITPHF